MEVITLIAQFGAVFAAAFLAFLLENVRERRRTTRWVRQYLGHLHDAMRAEASQESERRVNADLERQLAALDAWLVAEEPSDMTEEQWRAASESVRALMPDLGAVLRTEALTVLPHDVAAALDRLERTGSGFQLYAAGVRDARNDMLPAWHQRQVPLTDVDASKVRLFRQALAEVAPQIPEIFALLRKALDALGRWR